MDTVIQTIAKQIDFLDYRIIKADDVSLQLISNELTQNRNNETQKRFEKAIDSKGKKLNSIIESEEKLAQKKENSDSNKLNTLSLKDQVNFSTVTIYIYQNESVKNEKIININNINIHKPHLGILIIDSFKEGWYLLEAIITFIIKIWSLILIFILGFLFYKKTHKSKV